MRKYVIALFATVFILLFLGAVLNYVTDTHGTFSSKAHAKEVAKILLHGDNLVRTPDYDFRFLQKYWIEGMKCYPDVVVLGSSRSMPIDKTFFPGAKKFINNSMSTATLEDLVAVYGLYEDKGVTPQLVIIELSPWMMNANNSVHKWERLLPAFRDMLHKMGMTLDPQYVFLEQPGFLPENYPLLFSGKYVLESFKFYAKYALDALGVRKSAVRSFATRSMTSDRFMTHADGSTHYSKIVKNRSREWVRRKAYQMIPEAESSSLQNFTALAPYQKTLLEHFVIHLQSQGVRVVFFLPPYHPVVYAAFSHRPSLHAVLLAQTYFQQLAARYNVTLLGNYDPAALGLGEKDFLDGMHSYHDSLAKIFADNLAV